MTTTTTTDPYQLLDRPRIEINPDVRYLTGRRVLVTGAGGSIGSALCRELATLPVVLAMLDRDESALHALQLSLRGQALLTDDETILGDIRDALWMHEVFQDLCPDVVFHAAALKHQPMLERYPAEAVKTNVEGTLNVLRAAASAGVERLVNVSTDKAADPTCVLGASKRAAERLTSWYRQDFVSVRFGNVLGSRGSASETFAHQIRNGDPVTVTSPDMSRYFITSEEAVDLLLHAGAIGNSGEVLVMDMGDPINISGLARRIAGQLGKPADIVYTGARPGEKTGEVLLGAGEVDHRPHHPMIMQIPVPSMSQILATSIDMDSGPCATRKQLMYLATGGV